MENPVDDNLKYLVRWERHGQIVHSSIYQHFLNSEYCDVTLSAEGKQ